jgi:glycosyltransferase involved in cell wall biosynthesis
LTYDSIDPEEIERARNAYFDRNEMLDRLRVAPDRFIVLAVGQFVDRKGRWTFLEAAKKVAAQDNSIDFIWLTPSNPSEEDRSRILSYGLGDRFRLVSSTAIENSRNAVLQFYRLGDVFALPSFVEGLPISLLEAMAMGLPAISTNINGIPEAIRHEETGLLIEPGGPNALADAIFRLKAEPDLMRRLANAGRDHVLTSFDEREAARTAVAEYKRAFDPQK